MEVEPLPWDEVSKLIAEFGDQENIAKRIKQWREARGWSTADLASLMNRNQSSIWKIENPQSKSGGRNISIKDAIAFSRVFEKTLAEILLPDDALTQVEGWLHFQKAAEHLNDMRFANSQYENEVAWVRAAIKRHPDLRKRIDEHFENAKSRRLDQLRTVWENEGGVKGRQPFFEQYAAQDTTTPAIQASIDVLGDHPIDLELWTKTRRVEPNE